MYLSKTLNQNLLKALMGNANSVTIGANGSCWMGLSYTDPGEDGSGFSEPSGKGYVRTNIAGRMDTSYMSHAKGDTAVVNYARRIGNTDQIAFHEALDPSAPDAESGGDWGTLAYFGLFTAKTGGTPYAWGKLDTPVTINTHDVFLFRDGHFELTMEAADGEN